MLMFGAISKGRLVAADAYEKQVNYIDYLLTHKKIRLDDMADGEDHSKGVLILGYQLLTILLGFGRPQIVLLSHTIF